MYLKRYHDVEVSHVRCMANPQAPGPQPPAGLTALQAADRGDGNATKSSSPATRSKSTSNSLNPLQTAARPGRRRTKYYQFTAIDDCTRLRVLRVYPRCDQKTAIQFLDYVRQRLPFSVQMIQTDNGAEFQSAFHYHVLDKGIGHRYIRPAARQTQRKGGALPPHRRRGVLRPPRRRRHRRYQPVQQETQRVGRLLQLPSPPRRPRRPDALRTTTPENADPAVIDDRQSHKMLVPPAGFEPATPALGEPCSIP